MILSQRLNSQKKDSRGIPPLKRRSGNGVAEDIGRLGCWARSWEVTVQPDKCNIMPITRKRVKKINASDTLEGIVLDYLANISSILA